VWLKQIRDDGIIITKPKRQTDMHVSHRLCKQQQVRPAASLRH